MVFAGSPLLAHCPDQRLRCITTGAALLHILISVVNAALGGLLLLPYLHQPAVLSLPPYLHQPSVLSLPPYVHQPAVLVVCFTVV